MSPARLWSVLQLELMLQLLRVLERRVVYGRVTILLLIFLLSWAATGVSTPSTSTTMAGPFGYQKTKRTILNPRAGSGE
jgi:hypothetical protein